MCTGWQTHKPRKKETQEFIDRAESRGGAAAAAAAGG